MATYLFNDGSFYVTKLPETSYNTPAGSTGSDYLKVASSSAVVLMPNAEKVTDAGKPGNGHEFATYSCVTYTSHPAVNVSDDVNFEVEIGRAHV